MSEDYKGMRVNLGIYRRDRLLMVLHFGRFFGLAVMAILLASGNSIVPTDAAESPALAQKDSRDDASPWGVASGAEWFSAFPAFNPVLKAAGVRWLRGFYEWQTLQPTRGYWNWALTDRLVENARANGIHVTGGFAYFASWASADGGTRKFPIKDMQFWRDYVGGLVTRYHQDIKYWEVWNEFNGSFAENGTPEIYAQMVREASIAAKKIDPTLKIGMSVANFDVGFLNAAIKAGASGYYDYICVHPYEKLAALADNGEVDFLSMTSTLHQMLAENKQPLDTPLWITEIGMQTSVTPDQQADARQAVALAKAYLLSIASGFQRVFWFEARGPSYGHNTDHGLIRADFSLRPSYRALKTMSENLGPQPAPAGWLNLDGGYGFLFRGEAGYALAAWAPPKRDIKVTFAGNVRVADLEGKFASLPAGHELTLTDTPQLIVNLPDALIEQAKTNKDKPYPWMGDFTQERNVSVRMQTANLEKGVRQIKIDTTSPGGTAAEPWRRTDFAQPAAEGHYVYFAVDPQFVSFGTTDLEITAVVRRVSSDKVAGMTLNYETQNGYVNTDYFNIPDADGWHELTWKVSDANFVGRWGWNFRLNAISSPNEFLIKEIRVRKLK